MPKYRYSELKARADRVSRMVTERMKKLCREAGLDPSLLGIHPHNAMCSFEHGKPWPDVDYSKVRKILWLERTQLWRAHRAVDALYSRVGHDGFDWH